VVDSGCQATQETLVEVAGDVSRLSGAELLHLESCTSCRALADAEGRLGELFESAVPPTEPAIEAIVMRSVRERLRHRRVAAVLPVAASLLVALMGVAAIGGVPGGSLLSMLPLWSSQSWLALASAAGDWMVALAVATRAAQFTVPSVVHVLALVGTIIGAVTVVATTRRWRTLSPWRTHA